MRPYFKNSFALLLLTFAFSFQAFARIETVLGIPLGSNPNLSAVIPSSSSPEIMISRDQYVISYNQERRSPNWVAWKLELNQMGTSGRTNTFSTDPDLQSYLSRSNGNPAVDPTEYKGSCMDRGHQIPSADRTDTKENNQTTFVMSNMIPQTPYLNRVVWEHLENYTRDLVRKQNKKVFVIAGPVYDLDYGAIGPRSDIPIPSKDFKIIFILDANRELAEINSSTPYIAVMMPNTLEDGTPPLENKTALCGKLESHAPVNIDDWQAYKTTIPEIERLSGLRITQ